MLPWLIAIRGRHVHPVPALRPGCGGTPASGTCANIVVGVAVARWLSISLVHWIFGLADYPRSVFIIDSLLLIFCDGRPAGSRVASIGSMRPQPAEEARADLRRGRCRRDDRARHEEARRTTSRSASSTTTRRRSDSASTACRCSARATNLPRLLIASERADEVLVAMPGADPADRPVDRRARWSRSRCRSRRCRTCAICWTATST